jgi:hypothetical protein
MSSTIKPESRIYQDSRIPEAWEPFRSRHFFDVEDVPRRAALAADYASELFSDLSFYTEIDMANPVEARSETYSRLFTGMTAIVSNQILAESASKAHPRHTDFNTYVKPYLEKAIEAKSISHPSITDYVAAHGFSDRSQSYAALTQTMRNAAELVVDDYNLQTHEARQHLSVDARKCLSGLICEYMVIEGLRRHGFPATHYAPPRVDIDFAVDVFVPLSNGGLLDIQVKGESEGKKPLRIRYRPNRPDIINVAIAKASDSPDFRLTNEAGAELLKYIDKRTGPNSTA